MSGREAQEGTAKTMTKLAGGEWTMRRSMAAMIVGAACLAGLAGCGGDGKHGEKTAKTEAPAPAGVRTAPVTAEEVGLFRELAGSVRSSASSQVAARIMAQVVSVSVSEGDRVEAGRVLVTLDDRELQAKVRQAEGAVRQAEGAVQQAEAALAQASAQLELAAATHARYRALLEGRAVSRQEYEHVAAQEAMARAGLAQAESAVVQAKSGVAQAASGLEEAKTWLAFAVIASPVSGRVTAKRIDPGSMAAPGQPLLVIEQEGRYRLELPVDGSLGGAIARGTPLDVSIDAAGYAGTVPVSEIAPAADPVSRTFTVRADLPADPRLSSGQYARVRLGLGKRTAVVVPESALVRRGQLDGVFVESDGRLGFRIVQAGPAAGEGRREVLSGLAAGERVVVEGADRAVDGARLAAGAE